MKYLSHMRMVDLVSATEFHRPDNKPQHQILWTTWVRINCWTDSSPTSAAISDQHRNADIVIISQWHIYIGFIDVEIMYLSDIECRCFGNRIPSYFCRFHIGCYIGLTYSVVDSKTLQKWHFHLGFNDIDVRYWWLISCPQWYCIVFISFDINRNIGPT